MLEALKFVQRGVARKDIVPGLTHFRIKDGRCTGFNGAYSISAPVNIGFNAAPEARSFVRALNACEGVIQLTLDGTNLFVRSGDFRTKVPCISLENVPETFPEGTVVPAHASIFNALEVLQPFIGIDASRAWATGVLLANDSAYATNNVVLVEYWLGTPFPHFVNIPSGIIDEVVKVGEEVSHFQIADNSITFHYTDGRWIKSLLLGLDWPNVPAVMKNSWEDANLHPIPEGLCAACEKLLPFKDEKIGHIFLRGSNVSTKKGGESDGGAEWLIPDVPATGCYHMEYLIDVLAVADKIDFSRYPNAVPFMGGNLRGAICGVREV